MNLLFLLISIFVVCSVFAVYRRISNGTFSIYDFNLQRTLPIRGLLAVSIILHHLASVTWYRQIPIVNEFLSWGGVVVSVFFFLTGYGMMLSYIKKGRSYLDGFLLHRFKKVFLPLIIATICFLIIHSLLFHKNAFLSIASLLDGKPPLPTSWFVYTVLLFYCFFYLIAKIFDQKYLHIIIGLWIACGIYAFALYSIHWAECWYKSIYAIGIGVTYAYYENSIKKWITEQPQRLVYITVLCFALLCLIRLTNEYFIFTNMAAWKFFVYALTPLLIVLFVYSLGSSNNLLLAFLGRISYEIYLVQGAIITWFYHVEVSWQIYFVLTILFTFLTAWLLNRLCRMLISS
jgi:peptidoglycan/LPS O-acetylase OafA/YrhL